MSPNSPEPTSAHFSPAYERLRAEWRSRRDAEPDQMLGKGRSDSVPGPKYHQLFANMFERPPYGPGVPPGPHKGAHWPALAT